MFTGFNSNSEAGVEVASTTQYQNNGGLNALVHVLYENIDAVAGTPGAGALPAAFEAEHGFQVNLGELKNLLKDLSPVQREVVLGPVLRKMAPNGKDVKIAGAWADLTPSDVRHVANEFGITVEANFTDEELKIELERTIRDDETHNKVHSYNTSLSKPIEDALAVQYPGVDPAMVAARAQEYTIRLNRKVQELVGQKMRAHEDQKKLHQPGFDILSDNTRRDYVDQSAIVKHATLKLWSDGREWKRVVTTSDIADAHNAAYKIGRKPYNYDMDSKAVTAQLLAAKIEYDAAAAAGKPNPKINVAPAFAKSEDAAGKSATPEQHMQAMVEKVIGGITGFFPGGKDSIIGVIGQFLAKIIGSIFGMVPLFKEMGKQLKQGKHSAGSEIDADEIREVSAKDPKLGLAYHRFSQLSSKIDDPALNMAWRANPNAPEVWQQAFTSLVDSGQLDEADEWIKGAERKVIQELRAMERINPSVDGQALLDNYQTVVKTMEQPVLAYATPDDKARNLMERFTMYTTLSTRMKDVIEAHEKEVQLAQLRAKEAAELGALGALPVNDVLRTRLAAVQAELDQTDADLLVRQGVVATKDAVIGTLAGGGAGTLDGMFNAYQPELARVTAAARAEKLRLDREEQARKAHEIRLAELQARAGRRNA